MRQVFVCKFLTLTANSRLSTPLSSFQRNEARRRFLFRRVLVFGKPEGYDVVMMEPSAKFFILQSVRELLLKQEQEKEASRTKNNSLQQSLQRVQRKLKEQLLEEKRIVEKKLGTTKAVLKAASKHRQEAAHRLNALLKKRVAQNTQLSKVSDALKAASTSRAKMQKELQNYEALHNQICAAKNIVAQRLVKAESKVKNLHRQLTFHGNWQRRQARNLGSS